MSDIQLVNTRFGEDTDSEISQFIDEQLEWLIDSHREMHKNRIPKQRKLYDGTPATETKSFPWPNSSNVVVQVIGETVDTTVAWVLGVHYATHPLWVFQNYAKPKPGEEEQLEKQRQALEDFMDLMGYEPTELDLFRKEGIWYTDACKLGTAFVKLSYEHNVEAVVTGYTKSKRGKGTIEGSDETLYSGPQVDNLRHEDVLAVPDAPTLQKSSFVAQKRTLRKTQLEERAFLGLYDKAAVVELLGHPDRNNIEFEKQQELQDQGIQMRGASEAAAEWDIYECYFPWWHNGRKFRLIVSYHKATRKVLRSVFNFLPQNDLPIIRARLGYRNGGMYGKGFSELLEWYQEEVSTIHNQRNDNATAANTRMLRVSPRARNLDSNFEVYPFALLIGEKDDIEAIPIADVYQSSFQNEEMALRHVQSRAGVAPAIAGSGQGGMQKKNVYSAMGTLAHMQEGTTRTNLEVTDFRHAHVSLGSLLARTYAKFGVGDKAEIFGMDAVHLAAAMEAIRSNHMRIPIRAATASLNKEVEKQSDMLMVGLMQRHYTSIGQLMQAISNPIVPPAVSGYLVKVIQSSDRLMKRILKDFGYDQPDQFIPEPELPQRQPQGGGGPQNGGGQPVQGAAASAAGGGAGPVPFQGGGGAGAGPTGTTTPRVG